MTKDEFLTCLVRQAGGAEPLSREEEQRLGKMIKYGTSGWRKFAVDKLVLHNIRFVILEARRLTGYGHDENDMVQDGIVGLYTAAERFDPDYNNKFISYARLYIVQRIQRGIGNISRPVKLPDNTLGAMQAITRTVEKLLREGEPNPSIEEVAEGSGVHVSLAGGGQIIKRYHKALDEHAPGYVGGASESGDRMADSRKDIIRDETQDPSAGAEAASCQRSVERILGRLTARHQLVLKMRFGVGYEKTHTLQEVADHIGVTRSRIAQVQDEAIDKAVAMTEMDELVELSELIGARASAARDAKDLGRARARKRHDRNRESWSTRNARMEAQKCGKH